MANDYAELKDVLRERFNAATELDRCAIPVPSIIEWGFSLYVKGYLDACELKDIDPRLASTQKENKVK